MTRILIVDDDADILELLRLEFEDDPGCSADCVTDPARALELARTSRYDAIITDWRMPEMTGGEFVRALRKQGCRSYIIIYSGMDPDQEMFQTLETDADQYILRRGNPDREFGELKEGIRALPLHPASTVP
ncbi:response regulator receiver protein [Methanoregula boonei 6A8]|jgi:DNA-binding response OmpR family regulator|uniref:Response regulator receiver protein n=1 Tax=Methanoregula boonei (strain DSM 21154 / JCM 14090 / 6A8) TaxID=456442 RepID=A7I7A9_METB6|nr:response regulator [Methanoregula boonei]ABS55620.1 response regulator receiver protein [Methanoregula boonei 6A8]